MSVTWKKEYNFTEHLNTAKFTQLLKVAMHSFPHYVYLHKKIVVVLIKFVF